MIRDIYLEIRSLVMIVIVLVLGVGVLLFHPLVVPTIAQYALKDTGIGYSKLEGTLYSGFRMYDVEYTKLFKAQEIEVAFDLWHLWRKGLNINALHLRNSIIDFNALAQNSTASNTEFSLPPIALQRMVLQHVTLIVGSEEISIDGSADKSRYENGRIDIDKINTAVATRYADFQLEGALKENVFSGNSDTILSRTYFKPYLQAFHKAPLRYKLTIAHASATQLYVGVGIKHLELKEGNISINQAHIDVAYRYSDRYLDLNGSYQLSREETIINVAQQLHVAFEGNVTSELLLNIEQTPYILPQTHYTARFDVTPQGLLHAAVSSDSKTLQATLMSNDMQTFKLHAQAEELSSNVIPSLPQMLQNRDLNVSLDVNISTGTTVRALGSMTLGDRTTTLRNTFEYDGEQLLAQGVIDVHHHAAAWNGISTHNIFPVNFVAHYNRAKEGMLSLRSHEVYMTLFKREKRLNGWGSYKSSRFDIQGLFEPARTVLHVNNHVTSLYELINSVTPLHYKPFEYYDAELHAHTTVTIDEDVSVESDLSIPWYVAQQDSQTINFGHNSTMKVRLFNRYITLDEYNISVLDHRVYAQRDSKFLLDQEYNLHVNRLWIYDTLELTGIYESNTHRLNMRLYGRDFHYSGPEGDVRSAVDIDIVSDASGNLSVEGDVKVIEGMVTYYPSKSYLMRDEDIIIIQDVREPKTSKLFVNVHITSDKPLRYKANDIDVMIVPDITLWKESNQALVLLGMAEITGGEALLSDKHYEIHSSKLYFGGDTPINPYLDLNILREIDYKKIHIYVTNTMEDPVVLFSSTPSMSQNDIMSYLIFGTPANSAFEGGEELSGASAANLILGMGLKKMIGDTTGIHVDTLNILSSESGTLGFEVGTQINDRLRILLKNDSKFSAIMQYKLNRWLRLDVDVKETGQGINLIYVKDLSDPFQTPQEEQ